MKFYEIVKRANDLVASFLLIILLLPFMIFIILINALSIKGNPFFVQIRVGRNEKSFKICKLRTLKRSAPSNTPSENISNIKTYATKYSFFLRKTGIDEIPQLFNILIGQMSFIGPRPCLENDKKLVELRKSLGAFKERPGLTGLAQINSLNNESIESKAKYDAIYCKSISLKLDCNIFCKTIKFVFKRLRKK